MTILITGASGLVGSHLTAHLSASQPGASIIALYHRNEPEERFHNVAYRQCDLLDVFAVEEVMKGIQQVYHCAAIVSFNPADKARLVIRNQESTANVVNMALEHGVRRFIHVSSIAAIGRELHEDQELINEDHYWKETKSSSVYSKSKFMAETEVWRGFAEGLPGAIVNPGIILGEGTWHQSSGTLMPAIAKGMKWYTEGTTTFVDVKDLVRAMQLLMQSEVNQERFIIGNSTLSYERLFKMMADALAVPAPSRKASQWMSALIWRYYFLKEKLTGKPALITKETAHTAHSRYKFDNTKFLKAFPEFAYTDIYSTLQRMAATYKKSFKGQA